MWPPSYKTVRQFHLDILQPSPFLGRDNITVTIQKGSIGSGWLTAEEKSCTNASVTLPNVDDSILHTEGNTCGTIAIPIIKSTSEMTISIYWMICQRDKYMDSWYLS